MKKGVREKGSKRACHQKEILGRKESPCAARGTNQGVLMKKLCMSIRGRKRKELEMGWLHETRGRLRRRDVKNIIEALPNQKSDKSRIFNRAKLPKNKTGEFKWNPSMRVSETLCESRHVREDPSRTACREIVDDRGQGRS